MKDIYNGINIDDIFLNSMISSLIDKKELKFGDNEIIVEVAEYVPQYIPSYKEKIILSPVIS